MSTKLVFEKIVTIQHDIKFVLLTPAGTIRRIYDCYWQKSRYFTM